MGRIKSKARQARLSYQARVGRPLPLSRVAEELGINRVVLTRIEQGKLENEIFRSLEKLCGFYGVGIDELLEFDPNAEPDAIEDPALAAA